MAEVYGVLDLKRGEVVRAVAGERAAYRPVESILTTSSRPLEVALALREALGLERLYVADLDALTGGEAQRDAIGLLVAGGFEVLLDAAVRSGAEAVAWLRRGVGHIIAPLESLPGPEALDDILRGAGKERVVFSLDLRAGRPVPGGDDWPEDAAGVAEVARGLGVETLLLLDVARVGTGGGPVHLDLLKRLAAAGFSGGVLTGGGVRGREDLQTLIDAGASGVLVASALHNGAIKRVDLRFAQGYRPGDA